MSVKRIDVLFLCASALIFAITFPTVVGALNESTPERVPADIIQQSETGRLVDTSLIDDNTGESEEVRREEAPPPELPSDIIGDTRTLDKQIDVIESTTDSLEAELHYLPGPGEGQTSPGEAQDTEVLPERQTRLRENPSEALSKRLDAIRKSTGLLREKTRTIQQELQAFEERLSESERVSRPTDTDETGSDESMGTENASYCASSQIQRRHLELRYPEEAPVASSFYVVLQVGRQPRDTPQIDATQPDSLSRTSKSPKLVADSANVADTSDVIELGRLTKARLTSPGLEIKPITEVRQRTDSGRTTWKWWAKSMSEGVVTIHAAVTSLCGPGADGLQSTKNTYTGRLRVTSGPIDQFQQSAHEKPIEFGAFLISLLSLAGSIGTSLWRWASSLT